VSRIWYDVPMGTTMGALSLATVLAGAFLASACSGHLNKVPVQEVPISSFDSPAPIPIATSEEASRPPIIDMGVPTPPTTPAAGGAAAAGGATAATGGGASSSAGGDEVPADSSDPKIQAAAKLMRSGKRNDLMAARKLLAASVFASTGTPDQARLLRLACSKLGDKACVARCAAYIK
jgi:hypothetical protein